MTLRELLLSLYPNSTCLTKFEPSVAYWTLVEVKWSAELAHGLWSWSYVQFLLPLSLLMKTCQIKIVTALLENGILMEEEIGKAELPGAAGG